MSTLEQVARVFGRAAVVEQVEDLSPRVRRLRLSVDPLRLLDWVPGDKIKLHVGGGNMRSYTPARVDREAGWMDVVFYLHGEGPAAEWAWRAEPGMATVFVGPARSMKGGVDGVGRALFLGDETTLGLAQALSEATSGDVVGAIEITEEDTAAVGALGLSLEAVTRGATRGEALLAWLHAAAPSPEGAVAWLSGEAGSVLACRDALLELGWEKPQLRVKPYWSVRGKAHRKSLEKGALR